MTTARSSLLLGLCLPALLFALVCVMPGNATRAADNTKAADAKDHHLAGEAAAEEHEAWIDMFNGQDLTGWTPKFTGQDLGVNYKDTFRVVDGKLVVSYDNWEKWDGSFGHLFYETEYSHYIMRLEYRFVGEQVAGGPGWAQANNGIMYHGQPASTMAKGQQFPVSIEAQMLGGEGRSTGNVCTPGTHIHNNGELTKAHVIQMNGPSHPVGEWVTYEIEVHGSEKAIHRVNGEIVCEYGPLVIDDGNGEGKKEAERRGTTELASGSISLQAETAPIEFRNIRLRELP